MTQNSPSLYWGNDHLRIADELRERAFFEEAIARYQESLRNNPLNAWAYIGMAKCHDQLGNRPAAEEQYLLALRHEPTDNQRAHSLESIAVYAKERGEYTLAASRYEEATIYEPEWAALWYYAALCRTWASGAFQPEPLRRAIELDSEVAAVARKSTKAWDLWQSELQTFLDAHDARALADSIFKIAAAEKALEEARVLYRNTRRFWRVVHGRVLTSQPFSRASNPHGPLEKIQSKVTEARRLSSGDLEARQQAVRLATEAEREAVRECVRIERMASAAEESVGRGHGRINRLILWLMFIVGPVLMGLLAFWITSTSAPIGLEILAWLAVLPGGVFIAFQSMTVCGYLYAYVRAGHHLDRARFRIERRQAAVRSQLNILPPDRNRQTPV